ncbi:HEAT repeat domain-containing protein [Streptomyces sp. NPDC058877]|uniref:HEAT repeat domain-containing protein n=1 Tax=Streptomyces sp. NPDC058877 TaxID=3346665 RepID=UPI0036C2CE2F
MDVDRSGENENRGAPLLSAVRARDAELLKALLWDEDDREVLHEAFSLAVRSSFGDVAQLLLQHGADASRCVPEELPSLREAVDSGSPALVELFLDGIIRECPSKAELLEMADLARHWQETGVEAELRHRTGSRDAVVRTRVEDDEYYDVGEFVLGGTTARDGHGAILTRLEKTLGVHTPFEELMGRALAHAHQRHVAWGTVTILLSGRRDRETWTTAQALRTHRDPFHRLFGAEVMRLTHLFDDSEEDTFAAPALEVFTGWSAEEEDLAVLTEVLVALGEHSDPRAAAALLLHLDHPDARIRQAVAQGLGWWSPPLPSFGDVRTALLRLMVDPDAEVRQAACYSVAEGKDRDPVLTDAMAAALHDANRRVQLAAVYGLALHGDERCVEAARRLGPPRQPDHLYEEGCLGAAWRYGWRRKGL